MHVCTPTRCPFLISTSSKCGMSRARCFVVVVVCRQAGEACPEGVTESVPCRSANSDRAATWQHRALHFAECASDTAALASDSERMHNFVPVANTPRPPIEFIPSCLHVSRRLLSLSMPTFHYITLALYSHTARSKPPKLLARPHRVGKCELVVARLLLHFP